MRRVLLACVLALLAAPAGADPRAPVVLSPAQDALGPAFPTGLRLPQDLPRPMLEEEYLVSGHVDVFRYGNPPVRGQLLLRDDVETAYTTRILIRRPRNPRAYHGTLVVEWLNSTAGFDSAPAWDTSAEYFSRRGIAYVGITVSPVSAAFLARGCTGSVTPPCGDRYAALSLPEPGQAYEMVSQIVTLLRSHSPDNPLYPRFVPRRVFHVAQSQQASDITTYAREFHFEGNDGYFLQAGLGAGKPLSTGSPNFAPDDPKGLAPVDLPVPLVRIQTESEIVTLGGATRRQPAEVGPYFRYYEVAGMAHVHLYKGVEVLPGFFLEDFCLFQMNTGADGPVFGSYVYNAVWRNMERQVRFGVEPPVAEPILVENGEVVRDAFGNALGGIRLPALDVPIATYGARNVAKPACDAAGSPPPPDCLPQSLVPLGNLVCLLAGTTEPFEPETLHALYPRRLNYWLRVFFDSWRLRRQGFLLPADQRQILARAREVQL